MDQDKERKRLLSDPMAQARVDLREQGDATTLQLLRKLVELKISAIHLADEDAEGNETYRNKGELRFARQLLADFKK